MRLILFLIFLAYAYAVADYFERQTCSKEIVIVNGKEETREVCK